VNAAGVTNTEIRVGAIYDKTAGSLNKAYGFAGVGQIDQKAAYEHVRDYINAHGGIGGRKISLVWYAFDETTASEESIAQGACTTWTQQTRVFAAVAGGNDTLDACLSKAGIVQSDGGVSLFDSKTFRDYPYYIHLGSPGMDRLAQLYVDQMHAAGYYARGRSDQPKLPFKLGVVSWDDPIFARSIAAFRKALSRYGIALTDVAQVHRYHSAQEISDSVAGIQSAVLKFKTDNVSHVQFLSTSNAFEQLTFWQFADQQKYYPRYGLTSQDAAQALITTLGAANGNGSPTRTFTDSVGIGWFPLFDVPRADYSDGRESQALRQCKRILSYETFDDASRNKEAIAAATCDPMFYLKAAIERGGRIVNQHSWLYGVANVPSLSSALTFDMKTSASRHDGMGAIRNDQFYPNCTCFHYTSGLKKV
jgi:hypothetical protein